MANQKVSHLRAKLKNGSVGQTFDVYDENALHDTVNNLTTSTTGKALDAAQGPAINGAIQTISDNVSTLTNNVNNDVTSLRSSLNALTSRVDSITNLPSGSTSGDAELTDIRTGRRGDVMSSAGTSVRTQTSTLAEFDRLRTEGYDPIDFSIVRNSYPASTGEMKPYNGQDRSDFIPVIPGENLYVIWQNGYTNNNVWFKADKTPITSTSSQFNIPVANPAKLRVPDDAYYAVISNRPASLSNALLYRKSRNVALKQDVDSVHNKLQTLGDFVDLSSIPIMRGAIVDRGFNLETGVLTNPAVSTYRCLMGPFRLNDSVTIECDPRINYKLYKGAKPVSSYNDCYSVWQDTPHIVGSNSMVAERFFYYIQMRYTDDSYISDEDLAEFKKLITFRISNDENPLGLAETSSFVTVDSVPAIPNGGAGRICLIHKCHDDEVFYCKNNSISSAVGTYSVRMGGAAVRTASLLKGTEYAFLLVHTEDNSVLNFNNYSSFSELYSYVLPNFEEKKEDRLKFITGMGQGDYIFYEDDVKASGAAFISAMKSGLTLNKNGDNKFSHCPDFRIYNDHAYVLYQTDSHLAQEDTEYTKIQLAIINLSNHDVEYIDIAGKEISGDITFSGRCANPVLHLDEASGKLYIIFNGLVNGVITACVAKFNISSKTFTTSVITLAAGSDTSELNTTNFNKYIGTVHGVPDPNYEFCWSDFTEINSEYYTVLSSGAYKIGKTCLFKTTDFETFYFVDVLPSICDSDCESVIIYHDNKLYGASRHLYRDGTLAVWRYNLDTKVIDDYIQISDCVVRPSWFVKNNELYLVHGLNNRRAIEIMQLWNADRLATFRKRLIANEDSSLQYNHFEESGNDLYCAIMSNYKDESSTYEGIQIKFFKANVV